MGHWFPNRPPANGGSHFGPTLFQFHCNWAASRGARPAPCFRQAEWGEFDWLQVISGTNIFIVLRGAVETNRFLLNFGTIGPRAVLGNLFCTIKFPCSLLLEILVCTKKFHLIFALFYMNFWPKNLPFDPPNHQNGPQTAFCFHDWNKLTLF